MSEGLEIQGQRQKLRRRNDEPEELAATTEESADEDEPDVLKTTTEALAEKS